MTKGMLTNQRRQELAAADEATRFRETVDRQQQTLDRLTGVLGEIQHASATASSASAVPARSSAR